MVYKNGYLEPSVNPASSFQKFDAEGIFSLALQIFGITEDNIFNRLEKKVGAKNTDRVKIAWETVKTFIKDGVDGLWKMVTDKMDSIREMIVSQIIEWVQTKIISKAFTKLAVLFIPFAGLIAAVKTLWDTIKFIKEKIDKFRKLAESMLDVIGPAAKGDAGPAAKKFIKHLQKQCLSLSAYLLNLWDWVFLHLIKKILMKLQAPVNKVIDWVIDKILAGIDWLKAQAKSLFGGKDDEVTEAKQISATDEAAKTSETQLPISI